MAEAMSSAGNPAEVPASQKRVKYWDDQWYTKDAVLDWAGPIKGESTWNQLRQEKERCGVQGRDGVLYLEETWVNWYNSWSQPPGLEQGAGGGVRSAAKPLNESASEESSGAQGMASGSGSAAQYVEDVGLAAALRQAANRVAQPPVGTGTAATAMAGGLGVPRARQDGADADATSAAMPPTEAGPGTAAPPVLFTVEDLEKTKESLVVRRLLRSRKG